MYLPFAVGAVALLAPAMARGQAQDDVVRVEEDWELVLGSPDTSVTGPQINSVLAPRGSESDLHMLLNINHQTTPSFVAGGLEMQLWHDSTALVDKRTRVGGVLNTPGEVVTWTQAASVSSNILTFEVINGQSTTWETFGGSSSLRMHLWTNWDHLNSYDPQVSIASSGVNFAENRVQSLTLKRVRLYLRSGAVQELAL